MKSLHDIIPDVKNVLMISFNDMIMPIIVSFGILTVPHIPL